MSVHAAILMGVLLLTYCQKEISLATEPPGPVFDSIPRVSPVTPMLTEISGIADSKINPGHLWGHEDSGRPPFLYLVQHNGTVAKKIYLKGISNRDWEDMNLVNNEMFIGDIGDNSGSHTSYRIYKFQEPTLSTDTVTNIQTISFTYPDGSHDAEAFLVDPISKDIFIITKRDNPSKVYRLSYPYGTSNVLSPVGTLPYMGVVSASMSNSGKEIIVKTYTSLHYYQRKQGEFIGSALQKPYTSLRYNIEPQGEAVCFALDGSGFYTLSEKGFSSSVNVCFYKRN